MKAEEVSSVDSSDSVLLGHLDRKLGSLEQEQTDLMGASYDIKVLSDNILYVAISYMLGKLDSTIRSSGNTCQTAHK